MIIKADIISYNTKIDTSTMIGNLYFHIDTVAEIERDIISG